MRTGVVATGFTGLAGLLVLTLGSGPAHAAGGKVFANFGVVPITGPDPNAGAQAVAVECDAEAMPGTSFDVPITTSIRCRIDGITRTDVKPGAVAATAFLVIARRTFEVCTWAEATYLDVTTRLPYVVTDSGGCVTLQF